MAVSPSLLLTTPPEGAPAAPVLAIKPDPVALARHHATVEDVVVMALDGQSGQFRPLPTRVDSAGRRVLADAAGPGPYVAALVSTTPCMVTATEDCSSGACALRAYLASLAGLPVDAMAVLLEPAGDACDHAVAGSYRDALASLDAFLAGLAGLLADGGITRSQHDDLSLRAREARAVLVQIPLVDASGTWLGTLPLAGGSRAVALQLHQREEGSVTGYFLGAADGLLVTGGWVGQDQVHLTLEIRDGTSPRTLSLQASMSLAGPIEGPQQATLSGTLADGDAFLPLLWTRTGEPLTERRFLFADDEDSGASMDVALAVNGEGTLIAGGFLSGDCDFVGCGGEVYAMAEDPVSRRLWLFLRAGSGSAGYLDAAFDASARFYGNPADWQMRSPDGSLAAGSLVGFRVRGARSTDAAHALAALGRLADDIERGHDFTVHLAGLPHDSIDPGYLHDGTDAAGLLAGLATEMAVHAPIDVDLSRFRGLRSTPVQDDTLGIHPLGKTPTGIDFHEVRRERSAAPADAYRDVDSVAPHDELRFLRFESDRAVITGNRAAPPSDPDHFPWTFELPLASSGLWEMLSGVSGFLPYGVGTPDGGADAFRFRFEGLDAAPEIRAMADSTVVAILPDHGEGPVSTIFTMTDAYGLAYGGVIPAPDLGPVPPEVPVAQGTLLGTAAPFTAGGTTYHQLDIQAATDFGTASFCPFWLLGDRDRARILNIRNRRPYPQELTEPFVCNDLPTAAQSSARDLTWWLETDEEPAEGLPVGIRFTRFRQDGTDQPRFEYDLLDDQERVLQHGDVQGMTRAGTDEPHWVLSLAPAFGASMELRAFVQVEDATSAILRLCRPGSNGCPWKRYVAGPSIADRFRCRADDNPCTDAAGYPPLVPCTQVPNTAPCDDGDVCTTGDRCQGGECVHAGELVCPPPQEQCASLDGCDPQAGCRYVPYSGPCDDGNACTSGDHCQNGSCEGTFIDCTPPPCMDFAFCDMNFGCRYNPKQCNPGQVCDPALNACVPNLCPVGSATQYNCWNATCGTEWLGLGAPNPPQGVGDFAAAFPPYDLPSTLLGSAIAVTETNRTVLMRAGTFSSGGEHRIELIPQDGFTSVVSSIPVAPYDPGASTLRNVALLSMPHNEILAWFTGPIDTQIRGARLVFDGRANPLVPWGQGILPLESPVALPDGTQGVGPGVVDGFLAKFPRLASDARGLSAVAVLLSPALQAGSIDVYTMRRRCLGDDYEGHRRRIRQGSSQGGAAYGPLGVAGLPAALPAEDGFFAAWAEQYSDNVTDPALRVARFTITQANALPPISPDHQANPGLSSVLLDQDALGAACQWCPDNSQQTDGGGQVASCGQPFLTVLTKAFAVGSMTGLGNQSLGLVAFMAEVAGPEAELVVLAVDPAGTVAGCSHMTFSRPPLDLSFVPGSGRPLLFFHGGPPVAGGLGIGYVELNPADLSLVPTTLAWQQPFPLKDGVVPPAPDPQGNVVPLPGTFEPLVNVAAPRCCNPPVTVMGYLESSRVTRMVRFNP